MSLPLALFSVLFLIALIKLAKLVIKVKHSYTRQYEACPVHDNQEVDVELKIDDDGIGFGKEKWIRDEGFLCFPKRETYAYRHAKICG